MELPRDSPSRHGSLRKAPSSASIWPKNSEDASYFLIWGDIVHVPAVQSALPDAGTAMDLDPALAVKTRKETLKASGYRPQHGTGFLQPGATGV